MSSRTELLAFIDLVLSIIYHAKDKNEAYNEILELRDKIQVGAWDEVLSKINR